MRKVLVLLFLLALGAGLFLWLAKDWVAKAAFESAVRALTGFDTTVRTLRLDLGKGTLDLEGFTLLNPYDFEERVFADIPEAYLQMDLPLLLQKGRTHINRLRLNFRELNLEKNERGISNLSLLTPVKQTKKETASPPPKKAQSFQLDQMELTVRRVRYSDRSGIVPKRFSVDLKIENRVFEGVPDPQSIVNLILLKVLKTGPFGNLGVSPSELQEELRTSVKSARELGERMVVEPGTKLGKETVTTLLGKIKSKLETEEAPPK